MFKPPMRTALFIDGANMYAACKVLGVEMDYRKLLDKYNSSSQLLRAYYYTAIRKQDGPEDYVAVKPLIDWLDYNGYSVIQKEAKEWTDVTGRKKIKGNMDIEIAVDMMRMAPYVDHIYLFSGDGDFRYLINAVQNMAVRVTVVSTMSMVADELRRQADEFIDLAMWRGQVLK